MIFDIKEFKIEIFDFIDISSITPSIRSTSRNIKKAFDKKINSLIMRIDIYDILKDLIINKKNAIVNYIIHIVKSISFSSIICIAIDDSDIAVLNYCVRTIQTDKKELMNDAISRNRFDMQYFLWKITDGFIVSKKIGIPKFIQYLENQNWHMVCKYFIHYTQLAFLREVIVNNIANINVAKLIKICCQNSNHEAFKIVIESVINEKNKYNYISYILTQTITFMSQNDICYLVKILFSNYFNEYYIFYNKYLDKIEDSKTFYKEISKNIDKLKKDFNTIVNIAYWILENYENDQIRLFMNEQIVLLGKEYNTLIKYYNNHNDFS